MTKFPHYVYLDTKFWNSYMRYYQFYRDSHKKRKQPEHISLALPKIIRKDTLMAFEFHVDEHATIAILTLDVGGLVVPAPAGDVFSVVSNNPDMLTADMGMDAAGAPAVVLRSAINIAPPLGTVLTFTVSDSAGLTPFTQDVSILAAAPPPPNPAVAIGLDLANAVIAKN